MPGGWSANLEEVIEGERTGYQPPPFHDRFWEDVREGDELPQLLMPIAVTRCIYMASASRDFVPQHHHREWTKELHASKKGTFQRMAVYGSAGTSAR